MPCAQLHRLEHKLTNRVAAAPLLHNRGCQHCPEDRRSIVERGKFDITYYTLELCISLSVYSTIQIRYFRQLIFLIKNWQNNYFCYLLVRYLCHNNSYVLVSWVPIKI
jgi:hypothetical protein